MTAKSEWKTCDCHKPSIFLLIEPDGEELFFCENCLVKFVNDLASTFGIELLNNRYPLFWQKRGTKTIYTDFDSMLDEKVLFT